MLKIFGALQRHKFPTQRSLIKFYSDHRKDDFEVSLKRDYLTLKNDSKTMDFPLVWLRDNCQCERCFHPTSHSRIINWERFDVNVEAKRVQLKQDKVNIRWSDDHNSDYRVDWLKKRSFLKSNTKEYNDNVYRSKKNTWNKDSFRDVFKKFKYDEVLNKDDILKDWLENLSVHGVALITEVPSEFDSCRNLANRVEFIKRTHYGEEFVVQAKPDTTNVAYLSSNLQLHTDLPYYEYKPGLNLLHCVTQSQSAGGDNLLTDGHLISEILKRNHLEYYKILSTTPVTWEDVGEECGNRFHSLFKSPVICEDSHGNVVRINYSTPQRGSHFDAEVDRVKPWYEALRKFADLAYENSAQFKMEEGNVLCFDNTRLLHGRTEYKDSEANVRYVIGAYLDWDYVHSRLRVLKGV